MRPPPLLLHVFPSFAARGVPGLAHLHAEDGFGSEERAGQLRRRVLARRFWCGEA
jgi:hypothetical protein